MGPFTRFLARVVDEETAAKFTRFSRLDSLGARRKRRSATLYSALSSGFVNEPFKRCGSAVSSVSLEG